MSYPELNFTAGYDVPYIPPFEVIPRATPAREHPLIFMAGLIWGLLLAFSLYLGGGDVVGRTAHVIDIAGMSLALAFVVIGRGRFSAVFFSITFWLFLINMLAGLLSSILGTSDFYFMLKPVLLMPALAVMIAVAATGWGAVGAFRLSLTISGLALVVVHFFKIDFANIFSPTYRIFLFLNTNGVCYISMVTGLSLIDYFIQRRKAKGVGLAGLSLLALTGMCVVVGFATKARTGTLAFFVGLCITAMLALPVRRFLGWAIGLGLVGLLVALVAPGVLDTVCRIFQLTDAHRAVSTGTGRFQIWSHAIGIGFAHHPIIGMGLGSEYFNAREVGHIHNALLAILFDTGITGTVPVLIVLGLAAWRGLAMRGRPQFHFAIVIFWACLIESCAESMLFSMGNPAGLLFILSVVVLIGKNSLCKDDESISGFRPATT